MTLCINCGIELDDGIKKCPLCGKDPGEKSEPEQISSNYPSGIIQLQRKENRRYLWELSGIIAFSGIAVCTILDLLISKGLKWSLFSDVSILTAWVILTLCQFVYKIPLVIVPSLILTALAALFFIDLITTGREWFFPVGLPVAICAYISAGIIFILYKIVHLHGLNILASAFIVLSGFCILTELILDDFLNGFADIKWSLIVAVSVLPVALLFFFYHYRLKKGNRLDSLFHI